MKNEKALKRSALRLLKKARAWFKTEARLVKQWGHEHEARDGSGIANPKRACRACIVGAVSVVGTNQDVIDIAQEELWKIRRLSFKHPATRLGRSFTAPHSLHEVRAIYDHTIRRLERELERRP